MSELDRSSDNKDEPPVGVSPRKSARQNQRAREGRRLGGRRSSSHRWKLRSLYGKNPFIMFGPKAQLPQDTTLTIPDPTSQRLTWLCEPSSILFIKKLNDPDAAPFFKAVALHLIKDRELTVLVEESLMEDQSLKNDRDFQTVLKPHLRLFNAETGRGAVDLVMTLGGDGTLIHASSLFQQSVPPLMAFSMGSLGFLTPFSTGDFIDNIDYVLSGNANLLLRSRLKCTICRKEDSNAFPRLMDLEADPFLPDPDSTVIRNVLNDVVFDRGPSPYLSNIDLYIEGRHVTSVQGDGLIISTPTGSTAYAAAAGSSMMQPSVPAMLITPICPHSLSFRPIILPAGADITVAVSPDARNTAWASFDGRNREEIRVGDCVRITTSIYPLPSVCAIDQLYDWFDSLGHCLNWNERRAQKRLPPTLPGHDDPVSSQVINDSVMQ